MLPLTVFTLIALLCSTHAEYLQNRNQVGYILRQHLWKAANSVKSMTPEVKAELWNYSYRGLTLYILGICEFEHSEKQEVRALISSWEQAATQLSKLRKLPDPKKSVVPQNQDDFYDGNMDSLNLEERVNEIIPEIKSMDSQLRMNTQWMAKYESVNKFNDILVEFEMFKDNAYELGGFTTRIAAAFNLPDTVEGLNQILERLTKKESLDKMIDLLESIKDTEDQEITQRYDSLKAARDWIKDQINVLNKALSQKIFDMQNSIKQELKTEPNYVNYVHKLQEIKNIKEEIGGIKTKIRESQAVLEDYKDNVLEAHWKRPRVAEGTKDKLKERIGKISLGQKELLLSPQIQMHSQEYYFQDVNVLPLTQNGYHDLVEKAKYNLKVEHDLLLTLLELDRQIDQKFAMLLANLMNHLQNSEYVFFSTHEMSVLMYYMNISKIISSQSNFLLNLFVYMDAHICRKLVTRIRLDLLQDFDLKNIPSERICLLEPQSTTPSEVTPSTFVRDYSFFMSNQKMMIFKDHINMEEYSRLNALLLYLGISKASVLHYFQNMAISKFCSYLTTSLLVLVGLSVKIPFLVGAMGMLVGYLVAYVLGFISSKLPNYQEFKSKLYKAMIPVYEAINGVEFESLDYEEIISGYDLQFQDHFLKNLKRPSEEVPTYISFKFSGFEKVPWMVKFVSINPQANVMI